MSKRTSSTEFGDLYITTQQRTVTFTDGVGTVDMDADNWLAPMGGKLYPYYAHATFGLISDYQLVIHGIKVNDDGHTITLHATNIVSGAKSNYSNASVKILCFYYIE